MQCTRFCHSEIYAKLHIGRGRKNKLANFPLHVECICNFVFQKIFSIFILIIQNCSICSQTCSTLQMLLVDGILWKMHILNPQKNFFHIWRLLSNGWQNKSIIRNTLQSNLNYLRSITPLRDNWGLIPYSPISQFTEQLSVCQKELQAQVQELDRLKKIYNDDESVAIDAREKASAAEEKWVHS